jgi:hypothetical protein
MDVQAADLIIAVRKGHPNDPTIRNSAADERPIYPSNNVPDASQRSPSPDLTQPGSRAAADRRPHMTNEMGSSKDSFEVYLGRVDYPLDASSLWAKHTLNSPEVAARNAINQSEQHSQQKP